MIFLPTLNNLRYSYGLLAQFVHGLSIAEMDFRRLGLADGGDALRERQERLSRCALHTYNLAIGDSDPARLGQLVDLIDPELRGFAQEGVGLGLGILDLCTPWGHGRLRRYLAHHRICPDLCYIGAGQALAVFFRPLAPAVAAADPFFGPILADGYGFYYGFFRPGSAIRQQKIPRAVPAPLLRGFDAGIGRCLWFREGGGADRIAAVIAQFPPERQPALWSGTGFACAYAGGVEADRLRALLVAAGARAPDLRSGVQIAAWTRGNAGNPSPFTGLAAGTLLGRTAEAAHAEAEALRQEVCGAGAAAGAEPGSERPMIYKWKDRLLRED